MYTLEIHPLTVLVLTSMTNTCVNLIAHTSHKTKICHYLNQDIVV